MTCALHSVCDYGCEGALGANLGCCDGMKPGTTQKRACIH